MREFTSIESRSRRTASRPQPGLPRARMVGGEGGRGEGGRVRGRLGIGDKKAVLDEQ